MANQPVRTLPPAGAIQDEREIEAVLEVLRSGDLNIGENVARFEDEVSTVLGKELGVMVNSGSSALLLGIGLLDLEPGDEIITSVLTFSTDVSSIIQLGLVPVFVDVEPDTFQIDVNRIPEMIGPRTKAIMTPNLMGNCPDWDVIRAIADEHGLKVIEDSCDVLDTRLRGTRIGARSDISLTSFAISHSLTCAGNGGMVAMDDPELHDKCLTRRRWGRRSESYLYGSRKGQDTRWGPLDDGTMYDQIFIFDDLGYNFEPSELGAAYGLVQLSKLQEFNARRQHAFNRYNDLLVNHTDKVILPRTTPELDTTWMRYGFILRPESGYDRTDVQNFLEDPQRAIPHGVDRQHPPPARLLQYRAPGSVRRLPQRRLGDEPCAVHPHPPRAGVRRRRVRGGHPLRVVRGLSRPDDRGPGRRRSQPPANCPMSK